MQNQIHFEILDQERIKILPLLASFKQDFYLAGGTALALHLGHRDSIDFDFFTTEPFDTSKLQEKIETVFDGHKINIFQLEKNTLSCTIDGNIKLSFFTFKNKLLKDLVETDFLNLASLEDILCMKLWSICTRSVNKDYIDIYYLLKIIPLKDALEMCEEKMPTMYVSIFLKSLVYFDEMIFDDVKMLPGFEVDFEKVKKFLIQEVKNYN